VNHDLVTLSRGPGVELVVQRGLGQQCQGVGLLLLQRRWVNLGRCITALLYSVSRAAASA
jgi:hypothetical protein